MKLFSVFKNFLPSFLMNFCILCIWQLFVEFIYLGIVLVKNIFLKELVILATRSFTISDWSRCAARHQHGSWRRNFLQLFLLFFKALIFKKIVKNFVNPNTKGSLNVTCVEYKLAEQFHICERFIRYISRLFIHAIENGSPLRISTENVYYFQKKEEEGDKSTV